MISVADALSLIFEHTAVGNISEISITDAYGYILAEDIHAPMNMPPFRQSAMDGYAFKHAANTEYKIVGEVQAGSGNNIGLKASEAVRIFTGARVPDDADTVVMQEHTFLNNKILNIDKIPIKQSNVRPIGEQIKKGELVLNQGTFLNEAALGFLAGLGIERIPFIEVPKVGVLVTGDELQELGKPLREGQIYESNGLTLQLALKRAGIENVTCRKVGDRLEQTIEAIAELLDNNDVILISGGISVGDYDFVREALAKNGVNEIFYKINQKPGKPLWYGTKDKKSVFALPGNPGSSLTCFYVYVWPTLRKIRGFKEYQNVLSSAVLKTAINNSFGKVLFQKATVVNGEATQLTGQASSMLKSFAICNALLIVPEDAHHLKIGDKIQYIPL
ncbi:MAG: gephyrin-like molybdotransferase Glp [Leeuwenhoekiella sp.]